MASSLQRFEFQDFSTSHPPEIVVQEVSLTDGFPEHRHGFHELVLIIEGDGTQMVNGLPWETHSGDVFVFKAEDRHGFLPSGGIRMLNLLYHPRLLFSAEDELLNLAGYHRLFHLEPHYRYRDSFNSAFHLDKNDLVSIRESIREIGRELAESQPAWRLRSRNLFLDTIIRLCRYAAPGSIGSDGSRIQRIAGALSHLERHLNEDIDLDDLAAMAHMSSRHFLRVFRELRNSSPGRYVQQRRLEMAKDLLLSESSLSISEVAARCGYDDPNYFTRLFSRGTGMPPRLWRRGGARERVV